MANADDTEPLFDDIPPVEEAPTTEVEVPEAEVEVVEEPVEVPDVQIEANPDFEADGDVYVSVAEVPEEFRVSETDDRFLVGSATEVPPELAEQLADSAAVQVVSEESE